MLKLKNIHRSPVSLVKVSKNNNYLFSIPEEIVSSNKDTSVLSLVTDDEKNTLKGNDNLKFIGCKDLRNMLLKEITQKKDVYDFCSVIIINDIHILTLEKLIIINLWKEIFKNSVTRPYLIITTLSDLTPEFSFKINSNQVQDITKKSNTEILYHDENFTPHSDKLEGEMYNLLISMNEKTPVSESKTWLVFYCKGTGLEEKIYNSLNPGVNIFTSNSVKKLTKSPDNDKRTIIFINDNFFPSSFCDKIDLVIDSMIFKNDNVFTYSSKNNSEIRASYLENGKVYRFCTEDYYNELPRLNVRNYDNLELDKHYLMIAYYNINIENVFSNIVSKSKTKEALDNLVRRGAIANNKITNLGKIVISLPLKIENSELIYLWVRDKNPVFPAIVVAVMSELNTSFYFKKEFREGVFNSYLETLNDVLKEVDNLEDIDYIKISKSYNINRKCFLEVVKKIKEIVKILKKYYKFNIGNYNTENLIQKIIPYYEKTHYNQIYTVVDKKNLLYRNRDNISKLDFHKHYYDKKKIPTKIICFDRKRVNEEKYSVQKGKNYIYYFLEI